VTGNQGHDPQDQALLDFLSAQPRGRHGVPGQDEPPDVRWVVLHMIEETARHAGHLDIARELLDGQTGLGPR